MGATIALKKCCGKPRGQFWLFRGSSAGVECWQGQVGMDASVDPKADSDGDIGNLLNQTL